MHRQMNITSSDFTFTRNNDTQTSTQTQSELNSEPNNNNLTLENIVGLESVKKEIKY